MGNVHEFGRRRRGLKISRIRLGSGDPLHLKGRRDQRIIEIGPGSEMEYSFRQAEAHPHKYYVVGRDRIRESQLGNLSRLGGGLADAHNFHLMPEGRKMLGKVDVVHSANLAEPLLDESDVYWDLVPGIDEELKTKSTRMEGELSREEIEDLYRIAHLKAVHQALKHGGKYDIVSSGYLANDDARKRMLDHLKTAGFEIESQGLLPGHDPESLLKATRRLKTKLNNANKHRITPRDIRRVIETTDKKRSPVVGENLRKLEGKLAEVEKTGIGSKDAIEKLVDIATEVMFQVPWRIIARKPNYK